MAICIFFQPVMYFPFKIIIQVFVLKSTISFAVLHLLHFFLYFSSSLDSVVYFWFHFIFITHYILASLEFSKSDLSWECTLFTILIIVWWECEDIANWAVPGEMTNRKDKEIGLFKCLGIWYYQAIVKMLNRPHSHL